MDIILKLKEELNVEKWQVEGAVKLIDRETPFRLSPVTAKKSRVRLMMRYCAT